MKRSVLYRRIAALPEAAQEEVARLVERLETQEAAPLADAPPLEEEPFIGLWAGREDLSDSTGWVRRTRRQEWEPRG